MRDELCRVLVRLSDAMLCYLASSHRHRRFAVSGAIGANVGYRYVIGMFGASEPRLGFCGRHGLPF
jgi:hypothetical protein